MAALSLMKKDAAEAASSEGLEFLPKWKLALALGVPLVAVLGVGWYWYRSDEKVVVSAKAVQKAAGVKVAGSGKPPESPKQGSDVAEAMTKRGNALYREGKYREALAEFTSAVELCPKNAKRDVAILLRNRAACHEQMKEYKAVVEECTKALELDPKYIKALILRAKAWEQLDNLEEALFDITSSCILDSFQTQSSMATADRILKEIGLRKAKEHLRTRKSVLPSDYFIRNYLSSFCEDPITAEVKSLEDDDSSGVECNGDQSGSHYRRALRAMKEDDFETVMKECDLELQMLEERKNAEGGDGEDDKDRQGDCWAKALLLRGTMYFLMGDSPPALKDLTACIDHPSSTPKIKVNALVKRACQYLQDEEVESCFPDFERAYKLDPQNADVLHHRGQVMMLLEKYDKAIADFHKASTLQPNFPPPQIQKCLAEYRRAFKEGDIQRLGECSEKFRQTVDKFPDCADGFSIYGQILLDLQQFDQAEVYMDRAHRLTPKNAMILVHKGLLKIQARGNVEEAVKCINEAIEVDGKCEYAYETLATIEVQRGNLERAVELFNKAIHLGKTELELTHLISLRDAAATQVRIREKLGVSVSGALAMATTSGGPGLS